MGGGLDKKINNKSHPDDLRRRTLGGSNCYADYEGKKIPEEYSRRKLGTTAHKERIGAPKNQDSRNMEPTRRTVLVEATTSNS
ncbi:hypothetical protein Tco_0886374 [Tanacetum coccineum]